MVVKSDVSNKGKSGRGREIIDTEARHLMRLNSHEMDHDKATTEY